MMNTFVIATFTFQILVSESMQDLSAIATSMALKMKRQRSTSQMFYLKETRENFS